MLLIAEQVLDFTEPNWVNIVTPINTTVLNEYLRASQYPKEKSHRLIQGFENGFDIGYQGPKNRTDESSNIPLKTGTPTDL